MGFLLPKLIEECLKNRHELTLSQQDNSILFNINTGTKSDISIEVADNGYFIHTRYNKPEFVKEEDLSYFDLLWRVKDSMCGKDFVNQSWMDKMVEYGVMKKNVTTILTYS
jgi:hypothetical protein